MKVDTNGYHYGYPVIPLQYLTLAAGLAVREGADYDAVKSNYH
ncbi:MAG: hypothetical protein ACLR13_00680 [Acutalibacteraceae bacterium]